MSSQQDDTQVVNRTLFDYLRSKKQVAKCNTESVVQDLVQFLEKKVDVKDIKVLEQSIKNFATNLVTQWKKNSGCIHRFTKSNPDWFDAPINLSGEEVEEGIKKEEDDKVEKNSPKSSTKRKLPKGEADEIKPENDVEVKKTAPVKKESKAKAPKKPPTEPTRKSTRNKSK